MTAVMKDQLQSVCAGPSSKVSENGLGQHEQQHARQQLRDGPTSHPATSPRSLKRFRGSHRRIM